MLTLCAERLKDYYYGPRKVIPSLDLANGSERQQRSERREACVLLLTALLKYTDLTSLRVSIPTQDGFLSLTVDFIAKQTGMTLKRVERALADLKTSGLVTLSQPRKRLPGGSWKGLAAVKAISRHLFAIFGLDRRLKQERTKASKRLKQKTQQWALAADKATRAGQARLALALKALPSLPGRPGGKPKRKSPDDFPQCLVGETIAGRSESRQKAAGLAAHWVNKRMTLYQGQRQPCIG